MENFINHIKEDRDIKISNSTNAPGSVSIPFFIHLENFNKLVNEKKKLIEELMLDGDFYIVKCHLASLGNELAELYENLEEVEANDDEDCGCNDKKEE